MGQGKPFKNYMLLHLFCKYINDLYIGYNLYAENIKSNLKVNQGVLGFWGFGVLGF